MRKNFLSLISSCFLLIGHTQSISKKISLIKGQQLETVVISNMAMSQDMMGQVVEIKTNTTATSLVEVKDVSKESFDFASTIKRVVLTSTGMGQDFSFDSDKKEDMDGQIGQQFKGKIGVPQQVIVDKQGKIIEMSSADSLGNTMNNMMGTEMVKGAPFHLLSVLPSTKVKPGDSWTDSSGTPDAMKVVNTYTLKQVNGKEAIVDIAGRVEKKGKVEQMGMEIMMDLTGDTTGESIIDLATGLLKRNSTAMKITGTMELMGQPVPMSMNIKSETSVNAAR